jgi:hypothetical protein
MALAIKIIVLTEVTKYQYNGIMAGHNNTLKAKENN